MADGINVKRLIPGEICDNYMKGRQQKKSFYEPMSKLTKYFKYLHCNLGGPYFTIERGNQFYLSIWDSATGAYYAKSMKTKNQTFDTFQKFICQVKRQSRKKFKHLYTNFGEEFAN